MGGPGVLPRERTLGPWGGGRKAVSFLGWTLLFPLPETSQQSLDSHTAPALGAHVPCPSPMAVCVSSVCFHHRYRVCVVPCARVNVVYEWCQYAGASEQGCVQVSVLKLLSVDSSEYVLVCKDTGEHT